MKTIQERIDIDFEKLSNLDYYLSQDSIAVLDIETTGLSPAFGAVILVGIIKIDSSGINMSQFFATGPFDEEEILVNTIKEVSDCNYLITYNGRMFDIPFLEKRCSKYGLEFPWIFNLDLFLLFKHYSDLPKFLPRLNQKTLEEYAQIATLRQDRISGGDSVDLYSQYLDTGQKDLERRILLHNSDDVKQLLRLTTLLRNVNIHKSFYKSGFPIEQGRITGINLKKEELEIKGISFSPSEYVSFPTIESPYHFIMSGADGSFTLSLNCEKEKDNIFTDLSFLEDYHETFSYFPSYVNKYGILKENGIINHLMVNIVAKSVSEYALSKI